jgi:hypothetical protein
MHFTFIEDTKMKLTKESMNALLEKINNGDTKDSENPPKSNWISSFTMCGATITRVTTTKGLLKSKHGDIYDITDISSCDIGEDLSILVNVEKRTLVINGNKKVKGQTPAGVSFRPFSYKE